LLPKPVRNICFHFVDSEISLNFQWFPVQKNLKKLLQFGYKPFILKIKVEQNGAK